MTRALIAALIAAAVAGCAGASGGASPQATSTPMLPITSGDYPAYGHALDFSWIAGRLVRSSPAGQCTYVIFSTRSGAPWGGRVALSNTTDLIAQFPSGDMVVVTGNLDSRSLSACGQPGMRVRTIAEH